MEPLYCQKLITHFTNSIIHISSITLLRTLLLLSNETLISSCRKIKNHISIRIPALFKVIAKPLSIGIEKSQRFLSLLRRLAQCIAALWTSQTTKRAAKIMTFIVTIDSDLAIQAPTSNLTSLPERARMIYNYLLYKTCYFANLSTCSQSIDLRRIQLPTIATVSYKLKTKYSLIN